MNGPAWLAQNEPLITDWMQGWGSVLGLAVSLIAVGITGTLLWHEMREARRGRKAASQERTEAQQDRDAARRDRELAARERADLLMAHARTVVTHDLTINRKDGRIDAAEVSVSNHGSGPAIDIEVQVDVPHRRHLPLAFVEVLPPGETVRVRNYHLHGVGSSHGHGESGDVVVEIHFTDTAGLKWARRDNGQPERMFGDPHDIVTTDD